jgi:hypothetical protein
MRSESDDSIPRTSVQQSSLIGMALCFIMAESQALNNHFFCKSHLFTPRAFIFYLSKKKTCHKS